MANTYTQVHLQFGFAPKYTTGIAQANKHKLVDINGIPDHVHRLIGFRPTKSMVDLMQVTLSTHFFNDYLSWIYVT